jgi:dienelactone hydrolase
METLQKPGSWFNAIFYKSFLILKTMTAVIPWLIGVRMSVVKPRVLSFFQALRTSPPPFPTKNLKIGAAGFCWGGKYTVILAQDAPSTRVVRDSSQMTTGLQPLIDCGFTAHPSNLKMPSDIEAVTLPLSVAIGHTDMVMNEQTILKMKEILEVKKKGDHEVVIMPGAKHGFAVRTNPEDKHQMACAEQAEEQAVNWFSRWFV